MTKGDYYFCQALLWSEVKVALINFTDYPASTG